MVINTRLLKLWILKIKNICPYTLSDTTEVEVEVSLGKNAKTTGDLDYPSSYGMKLSTLNTTLELNFQRNDNFDLESVPVLSLKNSKLKQMKSQNQGVSKFFSEMRQHICLSVALWHK